MLCRCKSSPSPFTATFSKNPRHKELTEEQKKKRAEKRAKRAEKLRLRREQRRRKTIILRMIPKLKLN